MLFLVPLTFATFNRLSQNNTVIQCYSEYICVKVEYSANVRNTSSRLETIQYMHFGVVSSV